MCERKIINKHSFYDYSKKCISAEEILFLSFRYATVYTMFPVFSLVLDTDVNPHTALTYPELYKELSKGRSMSVKTFFIWVLISVYQGIDLQYLSPFIR